jgi:hypothetical protein
MTFGLVIEMLRKQNRNDHVEKKKKKKNWLWLTKCCSLLLLFHFKVQRYSLINSKLHCIICTTIVMKKWWYFFFFNTLICCLLIMMARDVLLLLLCLVYSLCLHSVKVFFFVFQCYLQINSTIIISLIIIL